MANMVQSRSGDLVALLILSELSLFSRGSNLGNIRAVIRRFTKSSLPSWNGQREVLLILPGKKK